MKQQTKKWLILTASREQLFWTVFDQKANVFSQVELSAAQDALSGLHDFLKKRKIVFSDIAGFGLLCLPAGLTSVKIWTTIVNTLGWSQARPVAAIFYPEDAAKATKKLLAKLVAQKKYLPIKPVYQYRPDIVIGKAKTKYKIVK